MDIWSMDFDLHIGILWYIMVNVVCFSSFSQENGSFEARVSARQELHKFRK